MYIYVCMYLYDSVCFLFLRKNCIYTYLCNLGLYVSCSFNVSQKYVLLWFWPSHSPSPIQLPVLMEHSQQNCRSLHPHQRMDVGPWLFNFRVENIISMSSWSLLGGPFLILTVINHHWWSCGWIRNICKALRFSTEIAGLSVTMLGAPDPFRSWSQGAMTDGQRQRLTRQQHHFHVAQRLWRRLWHWKRIQGAGDRGDVNHHPWHPRSNASEPKATVGSRRVAVSGVCPICPFDSSICHCMESLPVLGSQKRHLHKVNRYRDCATQKRRTLRASSEI